MAIASDRIRRARPLLGTFVEVEVTGSGISEMNRAIDAAFEAIANVQRPIDSEALGDATEIDPDIGISKADHLPFEQLDRIKRARRGVDRIVRAQGGQEPQPLQNWSDRHIENAF